MGVSQCKICSEPGIMVAVNELREQGCSIRDIAQRVQRSRASVHRHLQHTAKKQQAVKAARTRARRRRRSESQAGLEMGRAPTKLEPAALLQRARGLMDEVERVIDRAVASGDDRLVLQAQRELRESVVLCMKAIGMLQSDGPTVNVAIDQRQQAMNAIIASWDEDYKRTRLRELENDGALPSAG